MSEWQPIETAPKDGRFVMLHVPRGLESGVVTVGAYSSPIEERDERGRFRPGDWEGWLGMDVDIRSSWCDPTHWMPLPPPPKARPTVMTDNPTDLPRALSFVGGSMLIGELGIEMVFRDDDAEYADDNPAYRILRIPESEREELAKFLSAAPGAIVSKAPAARVDEALRRAILAGDNLLAELEAHQENTGEELEPEDQAVVHSAKADLDFARAALRTDSDGGKR